MGRRRFRYKKTGRKGEALIREITPEEEKYLFEVLSSKRNMNEALFYIIFILSVLLNVFLFPNIKEIDYDRFFYASLCFVIVAMFCLILLFLNGLLKRELFEGRDVVEIEGEYKIEARSSYAKTPERHFLGPYHLSIPLLWKNSEYLVPGKTYKAEAYPVYFNSDSEINQFDEYLLLTMDRRSITEDLDVRCYTSEGYGKSDKKSDSLLNRDSVVKIYCLLVILSYIWFGYFS